jgi:hypothetical protein
MDATRRRRTKDQARRLYYAGHRQHRFAKHMGFAAPSPAAGRRLNGPHQLASCVAITSRAADHNPLTA